MLSTRQEDQEERGLESDYHEAGDVDPSSPRVRSVSGTLFHLAWREFVERENYVRDRSHHCYMYD